VYRKNSKALCIVVCWGFPCLIYAANPAELETQQLLRQQEQERVLRERQEAQPDMHISEPQRAIQSPQRLLDTKSLPRQEQPCFPIKHIVLAGEAAEQFQWALDTVNLREGQPDAIIGQCLGTQGIDRVMTRLQRAIIDRGFVTTRVLLSPQKLDNGILAITVIPGRIHKIHFADGVSGRATKWNALSMKPGDLLNLHDIEQSLENFKRLPTATVDIQIAVANEPDVKPGDSNLIISWQQSRPFRFSAFVDDSGSRATGIYQAGITLSFDHPFTLNDLFYVTLNHDLGGGEAGNRGTRGYTIHYSVPYAKWLLSFTQSGFHYHQNLPGYLRNNLYSGQSDNSGLKLSRLLYRSGALKTIAAIRLWSRQSRNFTNGYENQDQQRRMAGWEASLNQRAYIQAATLETTLTYRRGTGMLNTLSAPEETYLVPEGTSRPQIIMAESSLGLPFKINQQPFQYNLNIRAQWNQTPLIPQDRFAIGSRYTVRGFDGEVQLIGERGYFVRNELSLPLLDSGQTLYVGLDYGEVDGPATRYQLGKRLMGGVIGLRGGFKGFNYDLFVGQPLKHPEYFPAPSTVAGFSASYQY
jgi:hemolysin activation/secretion protein